MPDGEYVPLASVVVPARNESAYIEPCLRSLLASDYPRDRLEVIVVDGMSDDGTGDIVRRVASQDGRVRLVENPRRITPVAFNLGVQAAKGEVVFIVGGHSTVPADFIRRSVDALKEHPEAWCVGGSIQTVGSNYVGRVISAAMSSFVGVGNARFRLGHHKGYVDTVTFPCYWRWVFDRIGRFDEELVRNQDDEFNLRLILAGGRIYLDADIRSTYHARGSLRQLARQYFQYGFWRIRTVQKHRRPATLRQVAPLMLVVATIVLGAASIAWPPARWALAACAALYGLGLLVGAADVARKHGLAVAAAAPLVFVILHFGYGLGSLHGLVRFGLFRRGPRSPPEESPLSR